jgi:hypothetical protein
MAYFQITLQTLSGVKLFLNTKNLNLAVYHMPMANLFVKLTQST